MDVLLNPNVAYLLLVMGFVALMMALAVPGTGLLEVTALFLLVLAGWEVYLLPINLWALGLLGLGVVPFVMAVMRPRHRGYLAASALLLVVGSAFLFRSEVWYRPSVHPALAVVASLGVVVFFWLVVIKVVESRHMRPTHDVESLIGQLGVTRTEVFLEGSVQVGGELWSARAEAPIPAGSVVRVVERDGLILLVEPVADSAT